MGQKKAVATVTVTVDEGSNASPGAVIEQLAENNRNTPGIEVEISRISYY